MTTLKEAERIVKDLHNKNPVISLDAAKRVLEEVCPKNLKPQNLKRKVSRKEKIE